MGRPVTRMLTRVLQRAGVRQLSQFSVIVRQNRRYDKVALKLRNVIIQRRLSAQAEQQPQRIENRRNSVSIGQSQPSSDIIQQVNVDESISNECAASIDDIEMNDGDTPVDDSSTNEIQEANDQQSEVDNHQSAASIDDIEMNGARAAVDASSTNDTMTNDENIETDSSGGQQSVTAFPGHAKKVGRKSFFNTTDMDKYVLKFQPSQPPRRRHSMLENRPPLSRINRFSLDSIPEERNILIEREASKATTKTTTTSTATTSSNDMPTGSGDSTEEPQFPRIKWKIPDLIPIGQLNRT